MLFDIRAAFFICNYFATIQYNYRPHKQLYATDSQIKKINFIDFHRKTSFACFKIFELSEAISRK